MKWHVMGLVVIGLVAAGAAAVLVASLRADQRARQDGPGGPGIDVLFAARDMPAMSVVDARSVVTSRRPRSELPANCVSDSVEVVGKVLCVPMVEGQVFTRDCFASKGSGVSFAAAVPEGMRAVSLSLSDHGAMEGLLYAGSVVDVLVSLPLPARQANSGRREMASLTLLRSVQVLAVDDQTVVSGSAGVPQAPARRSGQKVMVTLMVTPKQAEALQLAMEHGTVSLALRNPLDAAAGEDSGTTLSQIIAALRSRDAFDTEPEQPARSDPPAPKEPAQAPATAPAGWVVTFLRGGASQEQTFPMPGGREE